jgi:hypothetical protein
MRNCRDPRGPADARARPTALSRPVLSPPPANHDKPAWFRPPLSGLDLSCADDLVQVPSDLDGPLIDRVTHLAGARTDRQLGQGVADCMWPVVVPHFPKHDLYLVVYNVHSVNQLLILEAFRR